MMKLDDVANGLASLRGVIAVAIVDFSSGMMMASALNKEGYDLEVMAAGAVNIIRAKINTIKMLELNDTIHDIHITLTSQHHLLCPCTEKENAFIFMAIDRKEANLSNCRRALFQAQKYVV